MIHKDFESQKNHEIEESLKMTPDERIAQVVELIKRVYPFIKPDTTRRIHIVQ